jgi:hypothetical protein
MATKTMRSRSHRGLADPYARLQRPTALSIAIRYRQECDALAKTARKSDHKGTPVYVVAYSNPDHERGVLSAVLEAHPDAVALACRRTWGFLRWSAESSDQRALPLAAHFGGNGRGACRATFLTEGFAPEELFP